MIENKIKTFNDCLEFAKNLFVSFIFLYIAGIYPYVMYNLEMNSIIEYSKILGYGTSIFTFMSFVYFTNAITKLYLSFKE